MDLTWSQNLVYGLISGLTEILPVSGQAHRLVLKKIFGGHNIPELTLLLIHIGILAAVIISCQNHLSRIHRAKALARIPKKRRKRPLDVVSLMDYSLLQTMVIPVILAFILLHKVTEYENNFFLVSGLLLVNGIVLYIPQYLPGSNRDSRTLTRLHGIWIGLASALSALPGISAMGMALSVGQICGEDRKYGLNMALLLECVVLVILMILDIITMAQVGLAGISFSMIMQSILAGIGAFATAVLAIRFMGKMAEGNGFTLFAYYCWGAALFMFILTLFA